MATETQDKTRQDNTEQMFRAEEEGGYTTEPPRSKHVEENTAPTPDKEYRIDE